MSSFSRTAEAQLDAADPPAPAPPPPVVVAPVAPVAPPAKAPAAPWYTSSLASTAIVVLSGPILSWGWKALFGKKGK